MNVVTLADIQHVARLARVHLQDAELAQLGVQLDDILKYMQQLQAVPTDGVEPTSHVLPLANITRPDQRAPSLSPEQVLSLAPARHHQFVQVPRVLDSIA